MHRFCFLLFLFISLTFSSWAQRYYEVSTIDSAQVKVYAVDKPEDADLLVFFVYEAKDVTKVGYWMQVVNKKEANFLLIFVDDEKLSNIKICLVDAPEQAGLKNESKKDMFKIE
ncbi:MAG: hypothetical protein EHM93_06695 [Bacteroidales bacterium]|nr:MAG: hypothetical protein EHM93_06695 [Bacteroidales bacterium]